MTPQLKQYLVDLNHQKKELIEYIDLINVGDIFRGEDWKTRPEIITEVIDLLSDMKDNLTGRDGIDDFKFDVFDMMQMISLIDELLENEPKQEGDTVASRLLRYLENRDK